MSITLYQQDTDHDAYLAYWWGLLKQSGDLDKLFTAGEQPLSSFMYGMRKPTELVFELVDNHIARAAYFSPMPVGCMAGMWIESSHRADRASWEFVKLVLKQALATWPFLVGITRQPALLDAHRRLGYTISNEIPHAWGEHSIWLVTLTPAAFEEALTHGTQSRQERSGGQTGPTEPGDVQHLETDAGIVGGPGERTPPDGGDLTTDPAVVEDDGSDEERLLEGSASDYR